MTKMIKYSISLFSSSLQGDQPSPDKPSSPSDSNRGSRLLNGTSIPTVGRSQLKRPTNVPSLNLKLSGSDPNLSFRSGTSSPRSPTSESGLPRPRKSSAGNVIDIASSSKIPTTKLSINTSPPRSPGTAHKRYAPGSPQKRLDDSRNGNLKSPQVTSSGVKSQGSSPNGNNNNAAGEGILGGSLRSKKAEELLLKLQKELLA